MNEKPEYLKLPIVVDIGSGEVKAGFSGEENPKIVFKNYFGIPKFKKLKSENKKDTITIFNHIFSKLGINSEEKKEHPILISEPILNPRSNREKIAHILLDNLGIPAIFFASQPILSLLSTSATSGIILESGDSITQSCVVYEGYSIPSSYERYNYGGRDVSEYLKNMLKRRGYYFYNSTELKLVNEIKENMCYLETNKRADMPMLKKH